MWGSLVVGLLARPRARRVAALALVALTVSLFILNLRRTPSALAALPSGSKHWSATMSSTARCWTPPHAALAAVTIFLTACATAGSDVRPSACPPVLTYSQAEQARVAEEVAALPEGALIVGWLTDYTVLRDQARACTRR